MGFIFIQKRLECEIRVNPRKKPKFIRPASKFLKRVKESWRRPRGLQSKVRRKFADRPKMPSVSWGAPVVLRGLHPSGFKEVLVYNPKDLDKVNPKKEAIRIASRVGKKKRKEILEKAKKLKIKVLNPNI